MGHKPESESNLHPDSDDSRFRKPPKNKPRKSGVCFTSSMPTDVSRILQQYLVQNPLTSCIGKILPSLSVGDDCVQAQPDGLRCCGFSHPHGGQVRYMQSEPHVFGFRDFRTQFGNFGFTNLSHLRLRFAQADSRNSRNRYAVADQVVCHYVCAAFGQGLIVFVRTHKVGMAFDADRLDIGLTQALRQYFQVVLSFGAQ